MIRTGGVRPFAIALWLLLCVAVFSPAVAAAWGMQPIAELGPRPFYLIERMSDSPLRRKLRACAANTSKFRRRGFSLGHRGAPLQFPEHTREGYMAAARMGAGGIECDVTFTADKALVCRHSQCDLHATTNILLTDLASKCSQPFAPAQFDLDSGERTVAAAARCCTSDLTLAEFTTLQGKMDGANDAALTPEAYVAGTANYRTDLYAATGTLMTHAQSIELFLQLGVNMVPELKAPMVAMPYKGMDQQGYAQRLVDEYAQAKVRPHQVFLQSFNFDDINYWLQQGGRYGVQAVWLDGRRPPALAVAPTVSDFQALRAKGLKFLAPPIPTLLKISTDPFAVQPSEYARNARAAGLRLIAWTLERGGPGRPLAVGSGTVHSGLLNDAQVYPVLHALTQDVGVEAVFSDWPATTTLYANCMGLP